MPYRVDLDLHGSPADALDRLVELGALDVELLDDTVAAVMPDASSPASVMRAFGQDNVRVTPARGRDDESVWIVRPRPVRIGRVQLVPADFRSDAKALRLLDSEAFGTGLHPTTALCIEALDEELTAAQPASVLDVGTGSGVLALAALHLGAPGAVAIDVDEDAVRVAAANAALNGLSSRLRLVRAGPEALAGSWPLVLANVLTASLIQMAPALARRVAQGGRLVMSGIRSSLADDVQRACRRVGMRQVRAQERDGWVALTLSR